MSEPIRVDEWLAELARLSSRNDLGMTLYELAEAAGVSDRTMGKRLREAHKKGWVTVGRRQVVRLDGKPMPVPVYTVTVPKKGGGK